MPSANTVRNTPTSAQPSRNGHRVKLVKVDLACGDQRHPGFIGVDISPKVKPDVVHDLSLRPWPFEDDSVDEVYCSHFIEHVDDLCEFMNELWRIMKPGGIAKFVAPYYTSVRAWQDPTHKRAISEPMFFYFDREWRKQNKLLHYPIDTNFKVEGFSHVTTDEFAGKSQDAVQYAVAHYWNVVADIHVLLRKPKDE